jgi:hypothetical protein
MVPTPDEREPLEPKGSVPDFQRVLSDLSNPELLSALDLTLLELERRLYRYAHEGEEIIVMADEGLLLASRARARLKQSLSAAQHTEGHLQVVGVGEFCEWVGEGRQKRVVLAVDHVLAGTPARTWCRPKVSTSWKCRPIRQSTCPPRGCGRWWTSRWPTGAWRTSMKLEGVLAHRCLALSDMPGAVRSRTHFHWWTEAQT